MYQSFNLDILLVSYGETGFSWFVCNTVTYP